MDRRTRLALKSPAETEAFARALALAAKPDDCIALTGEVGAGKTTFARAFIQALIPNVQDIASPTFALMQRYDAPPCPLWHMDFYRLEHPQELEELGLEEALQQAISLIEWPEIARALLPAHTLWLTLAPGAASGERMLLINAPEHWHTRLETYLK